jgi:hypothetical protein
MRRTTTPPALRSTTVPGSLVGGCDPISEDREAHVTLWVLQHVLQQEVEL